MVYLVSILNRAKVNNHTNSGYIQGILSVEVSLGKSIGVGRFRVRKVIEQESSQCHEDIEVEWIKGGGGGCEDGVVYGVEIKLFGKVGQVAEERAGADEHKLSLRGRCT